MATLDFSNFNFSPEQIRNVRDLVWDNIVKCPDFADVFTIYPSVVSGKHIGFIGEGGLIIQSDNGCGSQPASYQVPTRLVEWQPRAWEAMIAECYSELENTAAVYSMNKGVAMADLANTDYINIVVEVLTESIRKSLLTIALLGDTESDNENISLINGIFKQMDEQITINPAQLVESEIDAFTFARMITQAPPLLRAEETAKIYTSQSLYNKYLDALMQQQNSAAFNMLLEGYKPSVLGVEIKVMPILDTLATAVGAEDTDVAFYTAPKFLGMGVDADTFGDVDVFFDKRTKKTILRAMGKLDAKLIDPAMFVLLKKNLIYSDDVIFVPVEDCSVTIVDDPAILSLAQGEYEYSEGGRTINLKSGDELRIHLQDKLQTGSVFVGDIYDDPDSCMKCNIKNRISGYWCSNEEEGYIVQPLWNVFVYDASECVCMNTRKGKGAFKQYFSESSIVNPPQLPDNELTEGCYERMFEMCNDLASAPELPAMQLSKDCYNAMFESCHSITEAPYLPATQLEPSCYYGMFGDCGDIIPENYTLPATHLADSCYMEMFYNSQVTRIPTMMAKVMADSCYREMFYDCTNLTNINFPNIEVGAESCCRGMFRGCSNLEKVNGVINFVPSADHCCRAMFLNCQKLNSITFGNNFDKVGVYSCNSMMNGCSSLKVYPFDNRLLQVKGERGAGQMFSGCGIEHIDSLEITSEALMAVAGMFMECVNLISVGGVNITKNLDQSTSNIFKNCSRLERCGFISVQNSTHYGLSNMFENCTSLIEAPDFTQHSIMIGSREMFKGCTSLEAIPTFTSPSIRANGCQAMFQDCTSLVDIGSLPATNLGTSSYYMMFRGCTSLTTTPTLPRVTLNGTNNNCYNAMFYECSSLSNIRINTATINNDHFNNFCWKCKTPGVLNIPTSATITTQDGDLNGVCGGINNLQQWTIERFEAPLMSMLYSNDIDLNDETLIITE